jgi:hypothetical protein
LSALTLGRGKKRAEFLHVDFGFLERGESVSPKAAVCGLVRCMAA